jgi:hypothetical protein
MKWFKHVSVPVALFLLVLVPVHAESRKVWQIGEFDQSSVEFSSTPNEPVAFVIGKSIPAKDWPRAQGLNSSSKILFSLPALEGTYSLKIAVRIERPRVPALKIAINSHEGMFFLHPKLSYARSDFSYSFDPHESQDTLTIDVPPSFLKGGENVITIACSNIPPSADDQQISGITYDALELDQDTSKKFAPHAIIVYIEPTIFYRKQGDGLVELVDAFIRSNSTEKAGVAELELNGKRYTTSIPAIGDYGEQRISFEVTEWTGTLAAKVLINAGVRKTFNVSLRPERKWTIFVVPHTHLDVGFTDYQGKVAEVQPRVLSQAADLVREHPDFRFSMDGSWNLQQLLDTRPKPKQDEILDLIRTGKMAMPAQYCNLLTGYASLETLYRSLYESKALSRRYNLPFEYANITDVPTYSGSYPSVLASSGVKYWVAASNNDRAPVFSYEQWNEKSPFWWEGPDGKKVLFWYSRHYEQVQTLFGLPPNLNAVRESLPIFLQAYSKPTYKPDVALIYGTQVENTDLFPTTATFADEWNKQYAYPKLNYSTFPDFFHYVDQHYGRDLPTYKGDGGGYWEDGIGSDSYFAAEDRQNQNRALSAEVLSSVTHSLDENLNPPSGAFDDIWRNIVLFSEHTWTAYNSISQPDHEEAVKQLRVKDSRADRAALEIEDVVNRSMSQLADQIHIPENTLVVFNSLSWRRDAVVETDLLQHAQLIDLTTHQEVPLQILYAKEGFLHVRFLAKDLPAVGYKCFSIHYAKEGGPPEAHMTNEQTVENSFYRIRLDEHTGALESIYDKQLQRELVDSKSPYKFGQYLYVTGGDGNTQMINPFPTLPPGELTIHPSAGGRLLGVEHVPWGESIRTLSSDMNTSSIEAEILLFNQEKKIEFRYTVHKQYTTRKEAAYFAFPVAVDNPKFTYATQQAWVDPSHDIMKGGSLEWFNVQHWMAAHDSGLSVGIVPVDASLASFGDINRGKWPGRLEPKTGTIFSYAMNNYWHTNYRAGQGGDFAFRYAITSSATLDGGALTKLGIEEMRPVELDYVVGQDKVGNPSRPLPPDGLGFLEKTSDDVALVTWKRAEDSKGMILRIAEISGKLQKSVLHFLHLDVASAFLCSGVEEDLENLPVQNSSVMLSFQPFEVVTIRVVESAKAR